LQLYRVTIFFSVRFRGWKIIAISNARKIKWKNSRPSCFVFWSRASDHFLLPFSSLKKDIMEKGRSTQKYKTNQAICPVYKFFTMKREKELPFAA